MRPYIAFVLFVLFAVGLNTSANSATAGKVGSGVATIVDSEALVEPTTSTSDEASEFQRLQISSVTPQALSVISLSDILGMYELISCHVDFTNGSKFDCNQVTFTGDMAITPHNTMWQRISFSGIQPIVASGLFTLSNNTMTVVNDLVPGTSVIPLTMDGNILTTRITTAEGTETDVWRKIYGTSTSPDTVNLSGTVKAIDGTPVCAMVLASGKFTFSCSPPGEFSLTGLPRQNDGNVTRQIYANGFFPKIDTLTDSSNEAVVMNRSGTCPNYNTPYSPSFVPGSSGKQVYIAGKVLAQNSQTPVCALVLANGQHMFTCDGSGSYALRIPLDSNGQFKLQVYASGYAPAIQTFDEFKTSNNVRMARALECQ